jgi:DNA-binding NarL/FixJ family response regulator
MNILHIDDHQLFCEGMALLLRRIDPEVRVRAVYTLETGLEALAAPALPDLILTDLMLPGVRGLQALSRLRQSDANVPVVVLAASEDPVQIRSAIDLGAMGYIPKSSSSQQVAQALKLILRGGVYLPLVAHAAPGGVITPPLFSPRQKEVLQGIVQGKPNKVIARDLGISETTVKTHVGIVLELLAVHNRTQALYALAKMGVALPDLADGPQNGEPDRER